MSLLGELAANKANDYTKYLQMTEDNNRKLPAAVGRQACSRTCWSSPQTAKHASVGARARRVRLAERNMLASWYARKPHKRWASMFGANTVANMLARIWGALGGGGQPHHQGIWGQWNTPQVSGESGVLPQKGFKIKHQIC